MCTNVNFIKFIVRGKKSFLIEYNLLLIHFLILELFELLKRMRLWSAFGAYTLYNGINHVIRDQFKLGFTNTN